MQVTYAWKVVVAPLKTCVPMYTEGFIGDQQRSNIITPAIDVMNETGEGLYGPIVDGGQLTLCIEVDGGMFVRQARANSTDRNVPTLPRRHLPLGKTPQSVHVKMRTADCMCIALEHVRCGCWCSK